MTAKLSVKIRSLLQQLSKPHSAVWLFVKPIAIASLTVTGLILGVRQLGGLQALELTAFDQLVRLRLDLGTDPRFLVVELTEADITRYKFPLSDELVAQGLAQLQRHKPRVIGLDLYRNLPQGAGQAALRSQFQAPNVIVITKIGTKDDPIGIPPPPNLPEERVGFNDVVTDSDGVVRRNLMFADIDTKTISSFSLQIALAYLAPQNLVPKSSQDDPYRISWGKAVFYPLEPYSGGYQINDAAGYQIFLNYRTSKNIAPSISFRQLLEGQVEPNWIKDKIVLIGNTSPSGRDSFYTPYSAAETQEPRMAGVQLHAQMTSHLLEAVFGDRPLFWSLPEWAEIIWIGVWAIAGSTLGWSIRHPLRLALTGSAALMLLFGLCMGGLLLAGWIPWVAPTLAFLGAGGAVIAYKPLFDAFRDRLTGLPNRALLIQRLEHALAYTKRGQNYLFAVLFLDLDRFKLVNESLGHTVGDRLLVKIARRLELSLHHQDTLARVGGDEFTILLEDAKNLSQVAQFAERIHESIKKPFNLNGHDVFITASIGIALGSVDYAWSEDLLRDAHTAMYHAKSRGKARHEVFNTSMRLQVVSFMQLESDLRRAVERQEFQVYYQPLVSLATGKIAGFEALVRWYHPQQGMISPARFIPIAEETGLIVWIGDWVLRTACQQLCIWQQKFQTDLSDLMMSVNLSGRQLLQDNLVEQVAEVLRSTGLNARSLKLEITESLVMEDMESTIALLLKLKALNIRLCVDDFGTGYSSLSYLHRFPVDTLKVDRSFVDRIGSAGENIEITRTVITLAHDLGMDVIAEGIETIEQLAQLRSLKCEYGQGYLFSKPLNTEDTEALLLKNLQW